MRLFFSILSAFFCWNVFLRHHRHDVAAFAPTTRVPTTHRPAISQSSVSLVPFSYDVSFSASQKSLTQLQVAISPQSTTSSSATTTSSSTTTDDTAIPFLIEELPTHPKDRIFKEICLMCIDAFFNDGATVGRRIPFYKDWQLSYLRNLQQNDLKRRRRLFPDTNMMFVARKVVPATAATTRKTPLLLDLGQVYNLASVADKNGDYCRGEVLGFVEVTQRPYSLSGGSSSSDKPMDDEGRVKMRQRGFYTDRPVLTNLSVKYEARKSGVGGRLLEQCERQVLSRWNLQEIVLEVEDDNVNALQFYAKRGYKELFEDPASRRYDTNGLILRQLRCRRKVLRKSLSPLQAMDSLLVPETVSTSFVGMAWQRIKDSVKL